MKFTEYLSENKQILNEGNYVKGDNIMDVIGITLDPVDIKKKDVIFKAFESYLAKETQYSWFSRNYSGGTSKLYVCNNFSIKSSELKKIATPFFKENKELFVNNSGEIDPFDTFFSIDDTYITIG